jgi:UDP-N-acetylglucosamine:LPS N-acetylglucosamine transferase
MVNFPQKAWVLAVDMGYGHQRTAHPLNRIAFNNLVINANNYPGMPASDKKIWDNSRQGYEFISAFGRIPLIGRLAFFIFDRVQKILSFYPKRPLSQPNLQLKQNFFLIKRGWGRHLIEKLKENPLPLISTFFTPAFMPEYFGYPVDIYCVICDTDISRTWASLRPIKSKIKYFAPTIRAVERLKLYGVLPENIFLTGYPLPMENIGSWNMEIAKEDLKKRLVNLDPQKNYRQKYEPLVDKVLGKLPESSGRPLTVMFAVGGAGAQKEIGVTLVRKLAGRIKKGEIKIILVAGIKEKIRDYFFENTKGLDVEIIFDKNIRGYFKRFNEALRRTDILWTKPSELSFYAALGLPFIIAPPIGSQEDFNKRWLLNSGYGKSQLDLDHVEQWLFDWLNRGYLAEAAMQGFMEQEKLGVFNIEKICFG